MKIKGEGAKSVSEQLPSHIRAYLARKALKEGVDELRTAVALMSRSRKLSHSLPEHALVAAHIVLDQLCLELGLRFVITPSNGLRLPQAFEPAALLHDPRISAMRAEAQQLAFGQRDSNEEGRYREIVAALHEQGIYFAVLLSSEKQARVYVSDLPVAHQELRDTLQGQSRYDGLFPVTSGMLIKRAGGKHTFVTDEWGMIWPEKLRRAAVRYSGSDLPTYTVRADLENVATGSVILASSAQAPILATEDGRALCAIRPEPLGPSDPTAACDPSWVSIR